MKKTAFYYTVLGVFLLLGSIASAQSPSISGLTLDASTPIYSTNDILTANYTANNTVETTASWYADWVPISVLQLPFEAGTSNALLDFSGSGNDLSLSGNAASEPSWGAAVGNNSTGAFTFDGNDYLEAGGIFPTNSSYTKSAWIYITSEFGYRNIISGVLNAENNHGFKVNPDGRLNAGHSFGSFYVVDSDSLHNGVWYHVAVTFDYPTGEMILYKNGIVVDRAIVPVSNRSVVDNQVLIGSKAYSFFWNGNIDDARVYDRALSYEQMQYLYTNGGDMIASQETRGNERWRVRVTPFSASEVGTAPITNSELIQAPEISGLSLTASSPESLTDDDLTASFSSNASVVETATTWYRDGNPDAVLYLPFEGGPVDALDDYSGNGNDASKVGNLLEDPTWSATAGHGGSGGFVFDGDDYLDAGNIFPLNSSYTKTAWVYSTVLGFNNIISSVLHDNNNHFLKVNSDGRLNAGHSFGTDVVIDPTSMNLNQWYLVAVTFDYSTGLMILYKDGVEVDRGVVPSELRSIADASVLIGSMNYLYHWDGNIDEPRIYDRALSPEQISVMYSSGNNVMVSEETTGGEVWHVEVTPFATCEAGSTTASNAVAVHSVVVSDIPDQSIMEGSSFSTIDLDNYVTVYEFTEDDIVWSYFGNSELAVTINPVTNVVNVTVPDINWYGSEDISFVATNPNADADTAEVTFTVTNVNDAPVLTMIGGQSTDEDNALTGLTVTFTDLDPSDGHTITVVSSDPNVTMDNLSGNISGSTYDLVPAADWNGPTQITVTVTDNGTGTLSDSETYTLEVNPINDAPVLTIIGNQATDEDITIELSVIFTDLEAFDSHTISVVSSETNVTVENLSGHTSGSTYDLVPAADWNGTAQITVTVTDDGTGALFDSETYTLTVNPINDAPVLTEIGNQTVNEDNTLSGLSVVFTDPEASDAHTITVVSNEANVSVENLSGHISGSTYDLVPFADWIGTAQITVTVTDNGSGALFDSETYTLTVHETNDAPVLTLIGDQSTDEDNALTGLSVIFTDLEASDSHTIDVVSGEPNVTVENLSGHVSGSTYDLVPAADWNGTAQITVTVTDDGPGALFDSETYTLTVNAGNDAPVITAMGDQSTDEDNALGLSVIFTDLEAFDSHTISVVSSEPNVTVENLSGHISGSTYDLMPAADWNGTAQITVTVTDDGTGALFDSETYTLTVNAVNDAPSSIALSNSTIDEKVEWGTVIGLFTSNDVEIDDTHQYELIPIGGTVDLDNEFFIIVGDTLKTNEEIDFEIKSSYSIFVQSDDGNGGTTSQTFIITINDVDETFVKESNNNLLFNVYPVPAVDKVTVEIDNPENRQLLLEIYTNTGMLVHSEQTINGNTVYLTEYPGGMYILSIRGENIYKTRKIIVKDK